VLILDEPTEGVQPNLVHEIGDVTLKLNRETGVTVLLVEQLAALRTARCEQLLNS
jgi:urea transport system ATP-binding protein